ncbi:MAG: hypothetical protein ACYTBZ_00875 [Planctomycetota bacterium]
MFKKIILALATFAFIAIAYTIYQWQDDTIPSERQRKNQVAQHRKRTVHPRTTQPADITALRGKSISFRDAAIPPGKSPKISLFDEKGNERIQFRSTEWKPVSDNEFHLVEPTARILLPRGQVAYVRADEGQVVVERGDSDNYNPKSGWMRGHVRIFIDRTTPQWRTKHPDRAEPDQHAESVVKIWMQDVRFDLDMNSLNSKGPIILQSPDGTIEGEGLELVWNEVDRKVKRLRIARGKRATVRGGALAGFDMTADTKVVGRDTTTQPATSPTDRPPAKADVRKTEKAQEDIDALEFIEPDEGVAKPKADRIDTYQIVFRDNVDAKQLEGVRVKGRLKAQILTLIRDFSQDQRSAFEHVSDETAPEQGKKPITSAPADQTPENNSPTNIELKWTGEMVITPIEPDPGDTPITEERFHIIATGNPVEVFDRGTGTLTCRKLKYHDETKQIWLQGAPDHPVVMREGPDRQLIGNEIFFDRKARIALVNGAGKLISPIDDFKDQWLGEYVAGDDRPAEKDRPGKLEAAWSRSVKLVFDVTKSKKQTSGPALASLIPAGAYIKHAVLDGRASFNMPKGSIAAERIEADFLEPDPTADTQEIDIVADTIHAEGRVRMKEGLTDIECDRLDVQMAIDDVGNNVPSVARAYGNILVRNLGRPGKVQSSNQRIETIRARDELTVNLASVPRPITPEEKTKYLARAKEKNIEPGSDEWLAVEKKILNRRKIELTRMVAKGQVQVRSVDKTIWSSRERFDLASDTLECSFAEDNTIKQSLVVGSKDRPGRVAMDDFYIEGPQISLDMTVDSVQVPGAGLLKFYTEQDLDGRKVDDPLPVAITWDRHMFLRGQANAGTFSGNVRAVSENNTLACREEMRVRFEDLPKAEQSASAPASEDKEPGGSLLHWFKADKEPSVTGRFVKKIRKRLLDVCAVGDAEIILSDYDQPGPGGAVSRILTKALPETVTGSTTQPADVSQPRLLSRVKVEGPQITIDLDNDHMMVEGKGKLLIENYRLPEKRKPRSSTGDTLLGGSSFSNLQGSGLSQTQFRWENSMSFLNKRNVAIFDHQVEMIHLAGTQMVLSNEIEAALGVDIGQLTDGKGRNADLSCNNLVVKYRPDDRQADQGTSLLSRAVLLEAFWATGRVGIREGSRSVQGMQVSYTDDMDTIRVSGSPQQPARIWDFDPETLEVRVQWRGRVLEWNLGTGTVKVEESRILAPR